MNRKYKVLSNLQKDGVLHNIGEEIILGDCDEVAELVNSKVLNLIEEIKPEIKKETVTVKVEKVEVKKSKK